MDNSAADAEAARMVAGMVRSRRMRCAAAGAAAIAALTGCAGPGEPTPSISAASSESSSNQALDAAVEEAQTVYEHYMAALPDFYAAESPDYTLLLTWATDEVATNEAASASDLAANGVTLEGVPLVIAAIVAPDSAPTATTLELGICSDVTNTRFVNGEGDDVTPTNRPNPAPLAIDFEREGTDRPWLIRSMSPWTLDESPCP